MVQHVAEQINTIKFKTSSKKKGQIMVTRKLVLINYGLQRAYLCHYMAKNHLGIVKLRYNFHCTYLLSRSDPN